MKMSKEMAVSLAKLKEIRSAHCHRDGGRSLRSFSKTPKWLAHLPSTWSETGSGAKVPIGQFKMHNWPSSRDT